MPRLTLTNCLLTGILFIASIPSFDARKAAPDAQGIKDCMMHYGCVCKGEAEIRLFQECYDTFLDKTKVWALEMANNLENCAMTENFTGDIRIDREVFCNYDAETQDTCLTNSNIALKKRIIELNAFPSKENFEEEYAMHQAVDCLVPAYRRCKEFPGSCIAGNMKSEDE